MIIVLLVAIIGVGAWVLLSKHQPRPLPQNTSEQSKTFTLSDVAQHNSKEDCWTVISDDVYDLTKFISRHPGGDEILRACGTDATMLFSSRQTNDGQLVGTGTPHSKVAGEQLIKLKIGKLAKEK